MELGVAAAPCYLFTLLRLRPQVAAAVNAATMEPVLGPGDFFSLAALALLEPLLMLRGYGRYGVCGAPLAGCVAVIVHTEVGLLPSA